MNRRSSILVLANTICSSIGSSKKGVVDFCSSVVNIDGIHVVQSGTLPVYGGREVCRFQCPWLRLRPAKLLYSARRRYPEVMSKQCVLPVDENRRDFDLKTRTVAGRAQCLAALFDPSCEVIPVPARQNVDAEDTSIPLACFFAPYGTLRDG